MKRQDPLKFQELPDEKTFLTIAPFLTADDSTINIALNAERTRYYRAALSQLFQFVGIANMYTSYDELAVQTIGMFERCGMCKDGNETYTYGVIGSPDVYVMAICRKCYERKGHPKWMLFPPMDT